jgi:hypothetical protein
VKSEARKEKSMFLYIKYSVVADLIRGVLLCIIGFVLMYYGVRWLLFNNKRRLAGLMVLFIGSIMEYVGLGVILISLGFQGGSLWDLWKFFKN